MAGEKGGGCLLQLQLVPQLQSFLECENLTKKITHPFIIPFLDHCNAFPHWAIFKISTTCINLECSGPVISGYMVPLLQSVFWLELRNYIGFGVQFRLRLYIAWFWYSSKAALSTQYPPIQPSTSQVDQTGNTRGWVNSTLLKTILTECCKSENKNVLPFLFII